MYGCKSWKMVIQGSRHGAHSLGRLSTEYGETFYEMIGRGPSYVVESHAASFTLDAVIVHTILLGLRSATFQMPCLTPKTRRICDETKHPRHRINWFGGRILFPREMAQPTKAELQSFSRNQAISFLIKSGREEGGDTGAGSIQGSRPWAVLHH
jgi:hypothetical protein